MTYTRCNVNSCSWDMTAPKTMQDRFFCLTYCSLETIQIHRSMKIEWSGMKWMSPSIFHGLSFALQFRHPWFLVLSSHLLLVALWATLLQVEVPEVPKPPKEPEAPEVPEVPELPKAPQGPVGQGRFGTFVALTSLISSEVCFEV